MDSITVRREIETAFAEVTRDPQQTLHQAQLTDESMSRQIGGQEWREAGELDVENHWSEVPGDAIDACDAALSHFTPQSWCFYLPAYLCRALDLYADLDADTELLEHVIFQLTLHRPGNEGLNSYLLERYERLSPSQTRAVRRFLEFIEAESLRRIEVTNEYLFEYTAAKKALDRYWGKVDGK